MERSSARPAAAAALRKRIHHRKAAQHADAESAHCYGKGAEACVCVCVWMCVRMMARVESVSEAIAAIGIVWQDQPPLSTHPSAETEIERERGREEKKEKDEGRKATRL